MRYPKIPVNVKLFIAITYSNERLHKIVKSLLLDEFGEIDILSAIYNFNFTNYYFSEIIRYKIYMERGRRLFGKVI